MHEHVAGDVSDDGDDGDHGDHGNKVIKNTDDDTIIEDRCKVKVWRCLSKVLESGVKHLEKPGGLWR